MVKRYTVTVSVFEKTNGDEGFNLRSKESYYFKDQIEATEYFTSKYHEVSHKAFNEGPIIHGDTAIDNYYYVIYEDPNTKNWITITVMLTKKIIED